MKQSYAITLAALLSLTSYRSNAQIVSLDTGTNVFLQADHVELGVGSLGYFGSDTLAPVGYHPHCATCITQNGIGFVADPLLTGWDTSVVTSAAHYYGDYFLPGSPFEGWELEVNNMRVQAFNKGPASIAFSYNGGMPACTGANISYTDTNGSIISTWQGIVDSVQITQTTTLDTGALYFIVEVTLVNTSSISLDSIYYMRSLDPDNDQTWSGSYATNNTSYNSGDTSIATATGTVDSEAYLALGAVNTPAKTFIYTTWPLDITTVLDSVYDEARTIRRTLNPTYSGVADGDYAIALLMLIPHLASVDSASDSVYRVAAVGYKRPANQATIKYFYSFSPAATTQAINSILASDSITTANESLINANTNGEIIVYPNPSSGIIYVTGLNNGDHVAIFDMMGKQAITWVADHQGINIFRYGNAFPAGGYIMSITDSKGNIRSNMPLRKN